jgi:hypothetical protein
MHIGVHFKELIEKLVQWTLSAWAWISRKSWASPGVADKLGQVSWDLEGLDLWQSHGLMGFITTNLMTSRAWSGPVQSGPDQSPLARLSWGFSDQQAWIHQRWSEVVYLENGSAASQPLNCWVKYHLKMSLRKWKCHAQEKTITYLQFQEINKSHPTRAHLQDCSNLWYIIKWINAILPRDTTDNWNRFWVPFFPPKKRVSTAPKMSEHLQLKGFVTILAINQ